MMGNDPPNKKGGGAIWQTTQNPSHSLLWEISSTQQAHTSQPQTQKLTFSSRELRVTLSQLFFVILFSLYIYQNNYIKKR